jgi:hypothetical protein
MLTVAMTVLRDWATTDRKSVLAAAPTETGTRVVTAVATTITSNDAEVGQAGAAAATPLSFIWPAQVPALVTALAETFDAHRDLESATGRAMQQALLSLIPLSSGEALVAVSGALLGTLETATNEADPATRMAIESVAPAAVSPAGRELVSGLVPGWRNRYDTTVANAGELRPPLLALCAAADHEAFAEDQEQAFWIDFRRCRYRAASCRKLQPWQWHQCAGDPSTAQAPLRPLPTSGNSLIRMFTLRLSAEWPAGHLSLGSLRQGSQYWSLLMFWSMKTPTPGRHG